MVTSISGGFATWLDGGTYGAATMRIFDVAALTYTSGSSSAASARSGVLPAGGAQALQVNAASGMAVTVNPGYCIIQNSASGTNGAYRFGFLTQGTLTLAAADATNPRIDLVCASVVDNGDNTSFCQVLLVTGTPAPSPSVPAAPANSITLAQIAVAANATSIVAGNITEKRVWTVPPGAILPVTTASVAPGGQNGSYVHDVAVGRLAHNGAAGVKQAHLLPFQPQIAVRTTNATSTGAETTVLSVNITVDGSTDIEVTTNWNNVSDTGSLSSGFYVKMAIYIDAVQVQQQLTPAWVSNPGGGGTGWYRTSSLLSTTPSAGAHTVTWKMQPVGTLNGDTVNLVAASGFPAQLVVKPICL
jgi:hypothetical protein